MSNSSDGRIVALDIGSKRIGVATAHVVARLATPLTTLEVGADIVSQITNLLKEQDAVALVVGLPRGLEGQETAQTQAVQEFVSTLRQSIQIPLYWQDEAVTSVLSEAALQTKKGNYTKGDIDALAASLILEDYLARQEEGQ